MPRKELAQSVSAKPFKISIYGYQSVNDSGRPTWFPPFPPPISAFGTAYWRP